MNLGKLRQLTASPLKVVTAFDKQLKNDKRFLQNSIDQILTIDLEHIQRSINQLPKELALMAQADLSQLHILYKQFEGEFKHLVRLIDIEQQKTNACESTLLQLKQLLENFQGDEEAYHVRTNARRALMSLELKTQAVLKGEQEKIKERLSRFVGQVKEAQEKTLTQVRSTQINDLNKLLESLKSRSRLVDCSLQHLSKLKGLNKSQQKDSAGFEAKQKSIKDITKKVLTMRFEFHSKSKEISIKLERVMSKKRDIDVKITTLK